MAAVETAPLPLPTTSDYTEAADALWAALHPMEHLANIVGDLVKFDEGKSQNVRTPDVSLADLGAMFVFLKDAEVVLRTIQGHVASIRSCMESTVYFMHLEQGTDVRKSDAGTDD